MATFFDIIAQLKFDVDGQGGLDDFSKELTESTAKASALEAKMKGLQKAILNADTAAKRGVLTNELRKTTEQLKRLEGGFKQVNTQVTKTGTAFGSIKESVLSIAGGTILGGGIAGLAQAVVGLGQKAFQTAVEMEALKTSLAAAVGGFPESEQAFGFLAAQADKLGLDLIGSVTGFKRLAASAIPAGFTLLQTEEIFGKFSTATAALNLSVEDTNGIFLALSQILSKGKVQTEELNQISERLPGTFDAVSKAMGKNSIELRKQLELGNVYANDLIPKLADVLENKYKDSIEAASNTTRANLNRLNNEIGLLFTNLGNSSTGLAATVIRALDTMLSAINKYIFRYAEIRKQTEDLLVQQGIDATDDIIDLIFQSFLGPGGHLLRQQLFPDTDKKFIEDIIKNLDIIKLQYTGVEDQLTAINKLYTEIRTSAEFQEKSPEVQRAALIAIQQEYSKLAGVIKEPEIQDPFKNADKSAEKYKKTLQDVIDTLNDAITKQRQAIAAASQKDLTGEAGIRQKNALERQKELDDVDKMQREIEQKLKGKIPATVTNLLAQLRTLVDERFNLELTKEINEFLEKQRKLIEKFNNDIAQLQAQAKIDTLKLAAGTGFDADIAILEAEFDQKKLLRAKEKSEAINQAIELGQSVTAINEVYRQQELNAEQQLADDKLDIQLTYFEKVIKSLNDFAELQKTEAQTNEADALAALNSAYTKGLISKKQFEQQKLDIQKYFTGLALEAEKTGLDLQLKALQDATTNGKAGKDAEAKIAELELRLAQIRQQLSELGISDTEAVQAKQKELQQQRFDAAQAGLDIAVKINDLIVQNEIEKYDKLISLQKERVQRANAIADKGNAEALQREEARLQQLTEQREKAAARQQRIASILNAANIALAATQSIVAITNTAAQTGVAAPVTIPIVIAALAAGIGIITSLISGFSNNTQGFEEGTPFVRGKKERNTNTDNIPAWLTEGERVVTVGNNKRYAQIYEFLEKQQPNPDMLLSRLKQPAYINYGSLSSQHVTAKAGEIRAIVESVLNQELANRLTAVNGNLEILVNETHKNRKAGTDINNVQTIAKEIAKELQKENLRWKL